MPEMVTMEKLQRGNLEKKNDRGKILCRVGKFS